MKKDVIKLFFKFLRDEGLAGKYVVNYYLKRIKDSDKTTLSQFLKTSEIYSYTRKAFIWSNFKEDIDWYDIHKKWLKVLSNYNDNDISYISSAILNSLL